MRKILAAALVTLVCGAAPASRPAGAGAGECLEPAGQWPWGPASSVALSGTRAYLGSGSALVVADIGSATGFEVESSMTMPGVIEAIEAMPSRRVLVAGSFGLRIVDFNDPEEPWIVGSLDTEQPVVDAVINGSFAYIVTDGRLLVDLSGDFAYTVFSPEPRPSPRGTLHVVDLIDPANPVSVGQTGCDWIAGVAAAGDLVFAADLYQGLCVIDVSVPDQPVKIAEFPFEAMDVAVVGDRAYVVGKLPSTHQRMEVLAFDVSDPSAPRLIGRNPLPDSSILSPRISTGGGRVFVASGRGGLSVYSGCPNPVRTGSDRRLRPVAGNVAQQARPPESSEAPMLID